MKRSGTMSLMTVLALSFFLLCGVMLFVSSVLQTYSAIRTQGRLIERQQQSIASEASKSVSVYIREKLETLETVAYFTDPVRRTPEERDRTLDLLLGRDKAFRSLYLYDTGDLILAQSSRVSRSVASSGAERVLPEVRARVASESRCVSEVYIEPNANEPLVMIGIPVTNALGDREGSLIAELNLKFMWELIDRLEAGENGEAYVVDRHGGLIAYRDHGRVIRGDKVSGIAKVREFMENRKPGSAGTKTLYSGISGATVTGSYVALGMPDWAVVTEMPWREAYNPVILQVFWTAVITFALAVTAGVIGVLIARLVAVPLVRLSETVTRIRAGELGLQARVSGPREVRTLAAGFNEMSTELRELVLNLNERSTYLTSAVERYEEHMTKVVSGNLTARIEVSGNGDGAEEPLVTLGRQLNETTDGLHRMILKIKDASSSLGEVSSEILAEITTQTRGLSDQARFIAQTVVNVDQVRAIAARTSEQAARVGEDSRTTIEVSRSGQRAVQDAIESMNAIRDLVQGIAESTDTLNRQMERIDEIVESVTEIATQSGVLALNAEIEAAHAGEFGKGFSIVASEVGKLADQSKEAASQIRTLIQDIRRTAEGTAAATEAGLKGVDEGVVLAAQARDTIDRLSGVIEEYARQVVQMSAGSDEQLSGIEGISQAMHDIDRIMTMSSHAIVATETAVQNLSELAQELNRTIERYSS